MARCRCGLAPNRPPGTVRAQNLWRKCSARALETHGDIVCELGFTERRTDGTCRVLFAPYSGRDRGDVAEGT
jgi:hypothetical protein